MATTTNGIYYPNDYDSVADIPADMKKIAESVDTKIAENKTEINNIKTEQTTQNTNISNLQKDNTTNKQDITNIKAKDTDQDKYIAELEAENARLREDLNGLPKGQASGESIDLNDSAEMRCELKISGNSKQETREGYNLLPNNATTMTKNGITFTVNEDGSVIIDGTAEAQADLALFGKYNNTSNTFTINGTVTFGLISNNNNVQLILVNEGTNQLGLATSSETLELTEDTYVNYAIIRVLSGATIPNQTFYPMIRSGSKLGEYEPYGASPSPDYPSEVESCGDNVNLFDLETWFNTVGSKDCTATLIKNGVKLDFVAGADVYLGDVVDPNVQLQESKRNSCIKVKPNTTYTIQMSSAPKCYISYLDSNYTGTRAYTAIYNNYSKYIMTFTTNETTEYIHIRLGLGSSYGGTTYTFTDIKLEEGTTPTPYTPYGQGCINEVVCNKNIFNKNDIVEDYFVSSSIVSNSSWCYNLSQCFKTGKKYTTSGGRCILSYFNGDTNISYQDITNGIITIPENTTKVYISTLKTNLNTLQIEEGNATEIVAHQSQTYTIPTQQPFRAIGDIRDTFIKKNNKWFERHYIFRKIFDGTESFAIKSQTEKYIIFEINQTGKARGFTNIICSHFKTLSSTTEECVRGSTGSSYVYINISKGRLSSIDSDGFKEWLSEQYNAGTPVYVDYILETPLDIECTEEQNTILDKIEKEVKTYKNVTHIYSTDEISPVIDVTYKKDIETMITNIEQAILSQGGNI